MTPLYLLFLVITLVNSEVTDNSTTCDGLQANFNVKDIIGDWYVVALIPKKAFDNKEMTCCKVEISETDGAGLRWLINKSVESPKKVVPNNISGTIVRLRYHTVAPFDVWSRAVEDINGCFQLVMSLDVGTKDIHKALQHDAVMQLHLLEVEGSEDPLLVQMLWGKMIGVVVFRRKTGPTQDELKAVTEFMNKVRGPQDRPLKLCDSPLKDILLH